MLSTSIAAERASHLEGHQNRAENLWRPLAKSTCHEDSSPPNQTPKPQQLTKNQKAEIPKHSKQPPKTYKNPSPAGSEAFIYILAEVISTDPELPPSATPWWLRKELRISLILFYIDSKLARSDTILAVCLRLL